MGSGLTVLFRMAKFTKEESVQKSSTWLFDKFSGGFWMNEKSHGLK